ncbi:MAG: dTDP-4-dehydrorhamnose 3,5-epimerase [Planctomycetales bacterium]
MRFVETGLAGAYLIEPDPQADERGFFARTFCAEEFENRGLVHRFAQGGVACNHRRGTLRGLHFQAPPWEEAKLVRCVRGTVYDVIVDLRPDSATRGRWASAELSGDNRRTLYVPAGFAHGYLTLTDDAELHYMLSAPYRPEAARGVRFDDPAIGIDWPIPVAVISERDRQLPGWSAVQQGEAA